MTEKQVPKYRMLKRELLASIDKGELMPGELMPSENELAERHGLSRQTVRQTFGELEREGRLHRVKGKGTFVAEPPHRLADDPQTVGLITTYISDYIFPSIVRGVEAALRERGYRLLLSSTNNDKERERESLNMMMSQPLSGLIVEPTKSAEGNPNVDCYLDLDYRRIPYVMINQRYAELDCPCLLVDDEAGGYQAAEHLLALGHRRIAGFFKTDDLQGTSRLRGFLRAHRDRGIPAAPDLVVRYTTEMRQTAPYEAALRLLGGSAGERPSAFVCYNDELAVQLLAAIRFAGASVPGDVSVVGFDDSPLATATEVKLTTLTHPKSAMGADAAELLLGLIARRTQQPRGASSSGKRYVPELIVRESTRRYQS
ncbi:GntR family transcriptional regulator [Paenibacillus cymbidii]|uniref:GntR family transcriptional regulator n=1 Tax=Paenibacillus cymbidii TaxID=1639034 RepID=UPI001080EDD9|nr:GntR family transcriptional regulator [Paenibacillus cymbidii]